MYIYISQFYLCSFSVEFIYLDSITDRVNLFNTVLELGGLMDDWLAGVVCSNASE